MVRPLDLANLVPLYSFNHIPPLIFFKSVKHTELIGFAHSLDHYLAYSNLSIYLSIGINVRFAAMLADVGDGLL